MIIADTIVAPATPAGRGGVAIVRVSGPLVSSIILAVTKKKLLPRQAVRTIFYDSDDQTIDEGIAIFFQSPQSFTGEDIVEFQGHASPIIVDLLLKRAVQLGARVAKPGEFSERAFLNHKMDLAQAEAVADLIAANSEQAARSALRSLQGEFSKTIHGLTKQLIELRMYLEASIDFADEAITFLTRDNIFQKLENLLQQFNLLSQQAKQGSLLRDGVRVAIAGRPNVGKSSLLNALAEKEIAIVTDRPGTTRDVLREDIQMDGMTLHFVDTAGLRVTDDIVEQEGIRRAQQEIRQADLLLLVTDQDDDELDADFAGPIIQVQNKIDLYKRQPFVKNHQDKKIVGVSARFKQGLDLLKQEIKNVVGLNIKPEGVYLARRRHLTLLAEAKKYVEQSQKQLKDAHYLELAAEDLRQAQLAMNKITGEFSADDLLGEIFSKFCIGK